MSSVDSRIVTMKFDNKQFQDGAASTMSMLDKLRSSLHLPGASKGLDNLSSSMGSVEGGITKINGAFLALGTVAVTAISNITTKVGAMGAALASELSGVNAMKAGFSDYELKVGATQTIMAGTGESIGNVTKYLKDLDIYADKTIYSLSDMTNNIGKFTNAGVKLPVAVNAMKGIANVAAISGASSEEAARAMYNLGQAIGQGTVKLMDWKSVELANMGTKEFKEQLIDSAVAAGTLTKGLDGTIRSAKGSEVNFKTFSSTLSEGWLTSKALTDTLGNYADETTKIGKKAYKAATEVKTFSMMMETLKAAAGTGWTDSFETVIGTLPQATKLFTSMTNSIGGFIGASADARNKVLKDWKDDGGRKTLIQGFKFAFEALGRVLIPIKEAFREIFPATTGRQLAILTRNFKDFARDLRISDEAMANLKATFKGVFAVFSIVKMAVTGVVGVIFDLIGAIGGALGGAAGGGILGFTAKIGDFISGLDAAIKKGSLFTNFFDKVSAAIVPVVQLIAGLGMSLLALATGQATPFLDTLATRFESLAPIIASVKTNVQEFVNFVKAKLSNIGSLFNFGSGAGDAGSGMKASLEGLPSVMDRIREAWDRVVAGFQSAKSSVAPIIDNLKSGFNVLKQKITEFVKDMGIEEVLALVNTGFFIALYIALKSFVGKMSGLVDSVGDTFKSLDGIFKQVTSNLKTMQAEVRSEIILKIAASLLLLAVALKILSTIDTASLGKSLYSVGLLIAMLVGALVALEKTSSTKGAVNISLLAVGLVALSVALVLMAGALKLLGSMDPTELNQGIMALAKVLTILIAATAVLGMTGGGGQLIATAAGIAVLAGALVVFAGAIKLYSGLDNGMLLAGGLKIAASLGIIALTMHLMPKNMLASAGALLVVSAALVVMSKALRDMSVMSGGDTAQTLVLLAGALTIIAVAMHFMQSALPGAAALFIIAAAMNVFIPAILLLGQTPWKETVLGMTLLAVAILLIGGAAAILGPVAPAILATASAMALLGLAALAVGAGLFLFATGLGVLAATGAAGAAALIAIVISIAQLFPLIMQQIGLGVLAFAKVIGDGAPVLIEALGKLLKALLKKLEELIPLLPPVITKALRAFLKVVSSFLPDVINAGVELVANLLAGLAKNVPKMARSAADLVIAFMNAWATEIPRLVDAGAKAVIKLLNGIAKAIDDNAAELSAAGRRIGGAIINGMTGGLAGKARELADKAAKIAKDALGAIAGVFKINSPSKETYSMGESLGEGLILGMLSYTRPIASASETVGNTTLDAVRNVMQNLDSLVDADLQPTITPVLDLSLVQSEASKISTMFGAPQLSAKVSYGQASSIYSDQKRVTPTVLEEPQAPATLIFEQNNYSPTALSASEIYRNTKSQISLAKEALKV